MATKIRLMRLGKIRAPQYRIVVADSRTKRDGRFIEALGKYHPKQDPSLIEVDSERVQYWLSVGAQPTEPVAAILRVTGDLQRFRGEPGESTLRTAAPQRDRKAVFEEAAREAAAAEPAVTPRKRAAKAAEAPAAEAPAAEAPAAEAPTAAAEEAPAVDAAAPDSAAAEESAEPAQE